MPSTRVLRGPAGWRGQRSFRSTARRTAASPAVVVIAILLALLLGLGIALTVQRKRAASAKVVPSDSIVNRSSSGSSQDKPVEPATGAVETLKPLDGVTAEPLEITQVERLQRSFSPTKGESVSIRFALSRPAEVTLDIHGPNREHIRNLLTAESSRAGLTTVSWDGRDTTGEIVPDEAYFLHIRAVAGEMTDLWDPWIETGGERVTAGALKTLPGSKFSYQIPRACRVLVRAAVLDGPLLRTLVNWQPRTAGVCVEPWDGLDADGLRNLVGKPKVRLGVMAFALPVKSILSIGNTMQTYRTYYERTGRHRQHLPPTPRTKVAGVLMSPHSFIPPHLNRDPKIVITFPALEKAAAKPGANPASGSKEPHPLRNQASMIMTLSKAHSPVLVRVDLPVDAEQDFMNNQRFELIIYVDDQRIIEVEQGHVPFTYPWDVSALPPGEHVLTVNVASFRNHVGTASRLVDLVE